MCLYLVKFNRLVDTLQVPGDEAKILSLSHRMERPYTQGAVTLSILKRFLSQSKRGEDKPKTNNKNKKNKKKYKRRKKNTKTISPHPSPHPPIQTQHIPIFNPNRITLSTSITFTCSRGHSVQQYKNIHHSFRKRN